MTNEQEVLELAKNYVTASGYVSGIDHDEPVLYEFGKEGLLAFAQSIRDQEAAKHAPQWQPIETAPMDGTDILVTNGKRIYVDFWLERIECWNQSATNESTHWMPLPAAPERSNAKEV